MCGRFALHTSPAAIALAMGARGSPQARPRYNVAPTQNVLAVRLNAEGERTLDVMRWGLLPHWAKDRSIASRLINARGETVATKPSYRDAFKRTRCLVPADGFYEWTVLPDGRKQPMYIGLLQRGPLAFAGLWSSWRSPEGEIVETCALITTEPNEMIAKFHDRMPVILAPEDYARWLDVASGSGQDLSRSYPADEMFAYPVSSRVNVARNDDPSLIERLAA